MPVADFDSLLERAGFSGLEVPDHSFTPPGIRDWLGNRNQLRLDRAGRRIPVLRHLAGSYTLVAHRR